MFGDVGHGILLLALAIYFIANEESLGRAPINELIQTPFDGRYVLLGMGIFAIYCGALYNEVFGMPIDLGTGWHYGENETMAGGWKECYKADTVEQRQIFDDPNMVPGCNLPPKNPYWFGVDPIWKYSNGGLIFFNSLKMKMSVVFGVVQMVFGIVLKATNDIKHKRPLDLWCEFVPQMIFMNGIFGYMVFLIFVKWSTCWVPASHFLPGGDTAQGGGDWLKPRANDFYSSDRYPRPYCEPIEGVNVQQHVPTAANPEGWVGYSAPPDIKQILIAMFMNPGDTTLCPTLLPTVFLWGLLTCSCERTADDNHVQFNLFAGMHGFHVTLVPLVMLMPLIMLLPKPLVLRARATVRQIAGGSPVLAGWRLFHAFFCARLLV